MKTQGQMKSAGLKTVQSVELFDEKTMRLQPVKKMVPVIIAAMLTLLVFNSASLLTWTTRLPVGPVGDFIVRTAGRWHDLMTAVGATRVQESLRQAFEYFVSL